MHQATDDVAVIFSSFGPLHIPESSYNYVVGNEGCHLSK
jgi:hypothetical protein